MNASKTAAERHAEQVEAVPTVQRRSHMAEPGRRLALEHHDALRAL